MFASTFGILLFGAKRPFARGGVPAACTLPKLVGDRYPTSRYSVLGLNP